ncbi:serine--tRNA ligase [Pedobacter arcticus]|uniref:serine--tRNA ligase n=1 Tax=Pedobacter arcticus TaxID=752140 RepID=UPI0002D6BE42|nr:serine--tRNA ligase [Pedobacter arcticus]
MLQVSYIRENKEEILERLAVKNFNQPELVDQIIHLDDQRKETQLNAEHLLAHSNAVSKQVGELMRNGKKEDAETLKADTAKYKTEIKGLQEELAIIEHELHQKLIVLPNLPHSSVPKGKTPEENEVILSNGALPNLPKNALPHWELASKYNLIDFELGVKITGAGFPVYKGKGAKMQRALINFFLAEAEKAGYDEMMVPLLVNEASGFGTGQLPDKEGQMYRVSLDNLYLIPTAEVPVTNLYRDVILKEEELPVRNCGYTPCFRREAGSYGAHVRGLNRLHQFDKVEIVQIVHPDKSYEVLEQMSLHVQSLLQKLGLQYRVLRLCGGDMGFTSALTYDMEVYSAAQERWLEVSSVSNFETFQSNRLKLRYKGKEGKTILPHTLNGSALALPRILASILENYQTEDGIKVPECLVPFTGFDFIG